MTEDMTKNELVNLIKEEFGMEVPARRTKEEILGLLVELRGEAPGSTEATDESTPADDRAEIMLPKSKKNKQPLYVGVNGKGYTIPRGVKVKIPRSVLGVLENAVETVFDPETMESREVPAHPFQVFG